MSHQDDNARTLGPKGTALDREQQMLEEIAGRNAALLKSLASCRSTEDAETALRAAGYEYRRVSDGYYNATLHDFIPSESLGQNATPLVLFSERDFIITSQIEGTPEHTHGITNRKIFVGKKADCPYCNQSLSLDLSQVQAMSNCEADHRSLSYHFTQCPECGLTLQDEEAL